MFHKYRLNKQAHNNSTQISTRKLTAVAVVWLTQWPAVYISIVHQRITASQRHDWFTALYIWAPLILLMLSFYYHLQPTSLYQSIITGSVVCSVCLFVTIVSCAKTGKLIDIPFGVWATGGPRNNVLGGGLDPLTKGNFWRTSPGPL